MTEAPLLAAERWRRKAMTACSSTGVWMMLCLLLMITICCKFMLGGRGGVGAMHEVTCILQIQIYANLTNVETQFCEVLILESVACCQFWRILSNMGNTSQFLQHVDDMLATHVAKICATQ